jgi:signal peptidase I
MARQSTRPKSSFQENLESILWAIALALVIRTFLVAPFKIPSGSMRPTLMEGDRILVNKLLYTFREPRRGDVLVFYYPSEWHPLAERFQRLFDSDVPPLARVVGLFKPGRPFIKRLVAVGGDRVEIRHGQLLVNGEPLASPGPPHTYYYNQGPFGQEASVTEVPAGMYYVLGDNSSSSHDSRFWGFVPKPLVIGRAMCIFWPLHRIQVLQ